MNESMSTTHSPHVRLDILVLLYVLTVAGCAQPIETIEMTSFDPSHDQMAIAGYYRDGAMDMREKAASLAESAVRYEQLFGPQSDWVSGARQLSQYYAAAAQEQERLANAHAEIARTGRQHRK
jgi:hypothetical protein